MLARINTAEIEIEATPEEIAKAFWNLGSDKQAEFFAELAKLTLANYEKWKDVPYSTLGRPWFLDPYAQGQWCWMKDDIKKLGGDAEQLYMAMAAYTFEFVQPKYGHI
jgi:hypothetical protein